MKFREYFHNNRKRPLLGLFPFTLKNLLRHIVCTKCTAMPPTASHVLHGPPPRRQQPPQPQLAGPTVVAPIPALGQITALAGGISPHRHSPMLNRQKVVMEISFVLESFILIQVDVQKV